MITEAKSKGLFSGMNILARIFISHVLFVHDVIIFWRDYVDDWKHMFKLFNAFCLAFGMDINKKKYAFYHHRISDDVREEINFAFCYN